LEDSLILILGDHGFPTGVRQNLSNEISFYDELFRVPLLMLWNGKIQPTQISNVAFSQIDIAPTILDLAGISTLSQFIGKPLPQTQQEANVSAVPVPILQPYDGVYLGSVLYPWKYVKSLSSGDEMLFNLSVDPLESKNLIHSKDALSHIPVLKETVKKIYLNQRLLTEDRIFTKGDQ